VTQPDQVREQSRLRWVASNFGPWIGVSLVGPTVGVLTGRHSVAEVASWLLIGWPAAIALCVLAEFISARRRGVPIFSPPPSRGVPARTRGEQRELDRAEARTLIGTADDPGAQVYGIGPSSAMDVAVEQRRKSGRIRL
jgi:hypothetical protein